MQLLGGSSFPRCLPMTLTENAPASASHVDMSDSNNSFGVNTSPNEFNVAMWLL